MSMISDQDLKQHMDSIVVGAKAKDLGDEIICNPFDDCSISEYVDWNTLIGPGAGDKDAPIFSIHDKDVDWSGKRIMVFGGGNQVDDTNGLKTKAVFVNSNEDIGGFRNASLGGRVYSISEPFDFDVEHAERSIACANDMSHLTYLVSPNTLVDNLVMDGDSDAILAEMFIVGYASRIPSDRFNTYGELWDEWGESALSARTAKELHQLFPDGYYFKPSYDMDSKFDHTGINGNISVGYMDAVNYKTGETSHFMLGEGPEGRQVIHISDGTHPLELLSDGVLTEGTLISDVSTKPFSTMIAEDLKGYTNNYSYMVVDDLRIVDRSVAQEAEELRLRQDALSELKTSTKGKDKSSSLGMEM